VATAGWEEGRAWYGFVHDELDTSGGASGEAGEVKKVKKWEACKPWRGARCALYHEHQETESCGDVFLGR
jgi:hypothetical protein